MRRVKLILLILALGLTFTCKPEKAKTLLERLQDIEEFQVTQIETVTGFTSTFQIDVLQYIDHHNPGKGTFRQRFFLCHRDESAPMVFYTSGYGAGQASQTEVAELLAGNQIQLTHRFFPNAIPSPLDWQYLTTWQAATDQHRIRELLGSIYEGKWVSSGGSKGGMTALYYRSYYPDDVDATVAYVAPMMERTDDPRFTAFLEQVGTEACRQKIRQFQREVLSRRSAMMPLLRIHAQSKGYTFSRIGEEAALEYSVLEYPFAFWQYGQESDCNTIPALDSSDQVLFDHLVDVSPLNYYADSYIYYYEPLFYQAYTEIGYCPYVYAHLQDLLSAVPEPSYRAFAPLNTSMVFRPEVMQDVIPWLRTQGVRILYIYGGIDPWTAGALNPVAGLDALQIIQPGANHVVKIKNLDQKSLAVQTLGRWLGMTLDASQLQAEAPERRRERL